MADKRFRIALTPGEPAGIGPDICIQLLQKQLPGEIPADIVVIADPELLRQRARELDLPLTVVEYQSGGQAAPALPGTVTVLSVKRAHRTTCGHPDPVNSAYVLETLNRATHGCLTGEFDALVTGPINKDVITQAGNSFSGHTEYLARLTGAPDAVMMLATPGLRVALVTTHLALKDIFDRITGDRVEAVLRTTHDSLRRLYGIGQPRLHVCGLNPHAGESGTMGREEIEIISPVIVKLQREGMDVLGPYPADTAFIPERLAEADAVVAMYHDQGLPTLKHMGFGEAVNVTLGLPIIRTSVDHGTALELAGTGRAHTGSLLYAIRTALEMTSNLGTYAEPR